MLSHAKLSRIRRDAPDGVKISGHNQRIRAGAPQHRSLKSSGIVTSHGSDAASFMLKKTPIPAFCHYNLVVRVENLTSRDIADLAGVSQAGDLFFSGGGLNVRADRINLIAGDGTGGNTSSVIHSADARSPIVARFGAIRRSSLIASGPSGAA